jgi:hypothetical protein
VKFNMKLLLRILTVTRKCLDPQRWLGLILRGAGGWYEENLYFRWRIHCKPLWAKILCGLAFLPVAVARRWTALARGRLELTRVELPVTTRCSLRCRDCANLIPFYPSPADVDPEVLIRDADDFLRIVDRVHSFSIMGGEVFMHENLGEVLAHLIEQDRIGTVQVATNGTIIPPAEILRLLAHPKVVVSVSNYPLELAPNKPVLLACLKEHGVNFVRWESTHWDDFGGFAPHVDTTVAALIERFGQCKGRRYHNLIDGEFHLCPRSAHGSRLGQFPVDPTDSVRFRGRQDRQQVRAEIRKLCRKQYVAACTKCKGGMGTITPAIQAAVRKGKRTRGRRQEAPVFSYDTLLRDATPSHPASSLRPGASGGKPLGARFGSSGSRTELK